MGRRLVSVLIPPYQPQPDCDCQACAAFALALDKHSAAVTHGHGLAATRVTLREAAAEVDRVHGLDQGLDQVPT
jgi:hypothetical protein